MKQLRGIVGGVLLASLMYSSTSMWAAETTIVGTWRLVSMLSRDTVTGAESHTWGEGPLGFITYTAGGRMSAILTKADRPISADSAGKAPVEEQAMLFRNSFAYAGRYSLTSDGVIHHVEVAADPTWMGKDQRRFARVEGTKLIISSPPIKSVTSPNPIEFSLVWERVE
ncbi:MAG: lipocalin-like domain-containing protein [Betaproteobacteria bacterium]|nr:lipocalin-like domain-containing protein [Betaproteobacteria bacterium]